MAKAYVTRCIVKRDNTLYEKGSVIEGLSEKEIKQGLAEHWLEAVGNSEPAQPEGKPSADKSAKLSKREKLLAKAEEAGVTIDDSMSDEEIQKLIEDAQAQ